MTYVNEKSNEIVIRSFQLKSFILGLIGFVFFNYALFVIIPDSGRNLKLTTDLYRTLTNYSSEVFWFLFSMVFYAVIVAASGVVIFSAKIVTTRIKANVQTVDITHRNLFSIVKTNRFYFSQIKEFDVIRCLSEEGHLFFDFKTLLYFNVIRLDNESFVKIQITGNRRDSLIRIREKLNKLLKSSAAAK